MDSDLIWDENQGCYVAAPRPAVPDNDSPGDEGLLADVLPFKRPAGQDEAAGPRFDDDGVSRLFYSLLHGLIEALRFYHYAQGRKLLFPSARRRLLPPKYKRRKPRRRKPRRRKPRRRKPREDGRRRSRRKPKGNGPKRP